MADIKLLRPAFLAILASVLLSVAVTCFGAIPEEKPTIQFAVLAFRPKPETLARWRPLVDYLNDADLGARFELQALTYPELESAVKAKEVGVVLTQPAHYILLANREGLYSPLATLVGIEGKHELSTFGGTILVKAGDGGIQDIAQLKGKRIATADQESLGGYLMQAMELLKKGIHLPGDARVVKTGMPHDKAIETMLRGDAEAAFIRTGVFEALVREGKLDPAKVRVLNAQSSAAFPFAVSTPLYPEWALSAMPWVREDLTRKIAAAALGLPHGGPVAKAARIHGFAIPGNYQPVEQLMRELRVPPFDTEPGFTFQDVLRRYQGGIILAVSSAFLVLAGLCVALIYLNRGLVSEKDQTTNLLKRLSDSESRYRGLVTSSPDWVWEVDARGVYTYSSPRVQDLLGYLPEEVIGKTPFDFLAPSEADRVKAEFQRSAESCLPIVSLENINLHRSGREVILETNGVPVLGEDGQLVGYRGIDRDVTARKLAEKELERYSNHLEELVGQRSAALKAAETRYRTVADFTLDWETWISPEGEWLYCSPSCERVTGHKAEEFVARPALFVELVHLAEREQVAAHLASHRVNQEGIEQLVFRMALPNGETRWIEHVCQPVFGESGAYLGRRASNRDITFRKHAEADLLKAHGAATVANVAKNAFLANMSHEMRTPLHQISGMAQLVRREPLTQRQAERMDKLEASLHEMTAMVEKMLQLTKIEAGQFELEEAQVDLRTILGNVCGMVAGTAREKKLQLLSESDPFPPALLGDGMHIQAALLNLVENAVKFTESGSVVIWARKLSEDDERVLVRLEVEDTGIGIAPEVMPRLFSLFEQADNSMTRRYGGTGSGLALVKKMAQIMGGDAGCSSAPGLGSIFWFTVLLRKGST